MLKLDTEVVKCLNCGNNNTFLTRTDIYSYGVWIAGNRQGDRFALVQIIDNPVFDEVTESIKSICLENNIADYEKYLLPEKTCNLFPIACDPVDGDTVSFRDGPRVCKYCGSNDLANTLSEPLCSTEVREFTVTYDLWNNKTQEEKKQLIFNALMGIQKE